MADTHNRARPEVDAETARDAAERAIDLDSLLDGEDPASRRLDEAEHWISAYSELVSYKDALLAASDGQLRAMANPKALAESQGVDVVILSRQVAKYRRRLEFWVRRRDELRSG
jgi:hypothetical protein